MQWISFKDEQPPIYDENGEVHMLCLLTDTSSSNIYVTEVMNAAYWEKHVKQNYNWTHWLILPKRPSEVAGVDPHAECFLCHPENLDEQERQAMYQKYMESIFGASASENVKENRRFTGRRKSS